MPTSPTGSTARDASALVVARVAAAVVSAGTWFLLINLLEPAAYGGYALAVGVVALVITATDLGLTSSLARYLAEGTAHRRTTTRVAAIRMLAALVGTVALIGVAMLMSAGSIPTRDYAQMPTLFVLAGILVVARSFTAFASGILPAIHRIGWLVAITVLLPLAEVAAVGVALWMGAGAIGAMWAAIASALVLGVAGLVVVIASTDTRTAGDVGLRVVGSYSRSVFVVWLAFAAFTQIDQVVIWAFHGELEVAPYAAAWQVVTLLHLPGLAVATVVAPRLARERDPVRRYVTGTVLLGALSLPLVGTAMALAGVGYAAVLRPYVGQEQILWALGGYAFLLGVAPLATMAVNYFGAAARRAPIALGTVALNLVLDLALVPTMGAVGAAIGTTIAFTVYTVAHVRLGYRLALERSALPGIGWGFVAGLTVPAVVGAAAGTLATGLLGHAVMEIAGPVAGLAVGMFATIASVAGTWYLIRAVAGEQWYVPAPWREQETPAASGAPESPRPRAVGVEATDDEEGVA